MWQGFLAENEDYVVMLANGFDWTSYSCSGWAEAFGTTYPILDGGSSGGEAWNLFGDGYIPHHVVLDGNKEVLYTASGSDISSIMEAIELGLSYVVRDTDADGVVDSLDNCIDISNNDQSDDDSDGMGNACDACDNNVFVNGNLDGDLDVDIFDVMAMVDLVTDGADEGCAYEASDMTADGNVNVFDIIVLVQNVMGGNQQQAIQFLEDTMDKATFNRLFPQLSAYPNPSNSSVNINGYGKIIIYDIMGRVIERLDIDGVYNWNTNNLPSGVYRIINGKEKISVTLVK